MLKWKAIRRRRRRRRRRRIVSNNFGNCNKENLQKRCSGLDGVQNGHSNERVSYLM
jgi:hypothetical protein